MCSSLPLPLAVRHLRAELGMFVLIEPVDEWIQRLASTAGARRYEIGVSWMIAAELTEAGSGKY
jgi:hypothetical protein